MATNRTISAIKADVKAALDEVLANESELFGQDSDQANLDTIIVSKIEDAVRHIYLVADEQFLEPEETTGTVAAADVRDADGIKYIEVQKKFLRFVSAMASGWTHPVTDLILQKESRYCMLFNRYASGSGSRPRAALKGPKTLQLFGCGVPPTGVAYTVTTVQMPVKVTPSGGASGSSGASEPYYSIYDDLYRPIIYYIAGLTLLTQRDEHAETLLNMGLVEAGVNTAQPNNQ